MEESDRLGFQTISQTKGFVSEGEILSKDDPLFLFFLFSFQSVELFRNQYKTLSISETFLLAGIY